MNGVLILSNNVEFKLENNLSVGKQDVPYQMLGNTMHIEMFGNKKICFEGKYNILEYTSELVKIKCQKNLLIFSGINLNISNIQKTSFLLSGKINSLVFE